MKRLVAMFALVAAACLPLAALDFIAEAGLVLDSEAMKATEAANGVYGSFVGGLSHAGDGVSISWLLELSNEGRYPAPFLGGYYGGSAVEILEAGMRLEFGALGAALGYLPNTDAVDSPYALFASGAVRSALLAEFSYESERFFFVNRWIGLNANLDGGIYESVVTTDGARLDADRGASLKYYGLKFGDFRFGFEDASVYTGTYFDPLYFMNPAPGFFVQYVTTASGRPWSRLGNQNSILGFFADYDDGTWSGYGQWLVDDINMNRFLDPSGVQNPDKMALSAGVAWKSPWGELAAHAAAATKYTFSSIGGEFYSYTYYPGSAIHSGSYYVGIPIEEQMIGYVHGENSFAVMATWADSVAGFDLDAGLEFTLSGAKSPANPWHDGEDWSETGTRWLDGALLEQRLLATFAGVRSFGSIQVSIEGAFGYVANRLKLAAVVDSNGDGNQEPVWRPSAGLELLGNLGVRIRYSLDF